MNIIIEVGSKDKFYPIKKIKEQLYKVSWGLQEIDDNTYSWKYCILTYKPSLDKIKKIIEDDINKKTKNSIINRFYWNDMKVDLTLEKQLDYKLLYDSSLI